MGVLATSDILILEENIHESLHYMCLTFRLTELNIVTTVFLKTCSYVPVFNNCVFLPLM